MADYTSLGAFNTGGASSLNGELIQKLYDAETVSTVDPITESLELIETETTLISDIGTLVNELIDTVEVFDLFSSGANAFEQVTATASGDSAFFDAADVSALSKGTTYVSITQLSQKDSYQSEKFDSAEDLVSGGQLSTSQITIDVDGTGGSDPLVFKTEGQTYQEIVDSINATGIIDASIQQVSDSEYRLVVKSQEEGSANALTISQTDVDLGFDTENVQVNSTDINSSATTVAGDLVMNGVTFNQDGTETYSDLVTKINDHTDFSATLNSDNQIEITRTDGSQVDVTTDDFSLGFTGENLNHILKAQNLNATVDGVAYDVSSNSITIDGNLKITASAIGDSSVSIQSDDSSIVPAVEEFAAKYNELLLKITEEIYSTEQSAQDISSLKTILSDVKSMMFDNYGVNDDNLLNYGFGFDSETGALEIDTVALGAAITDDPDKVKALFIGVAEDKGFGTMLKEHLDDLNSYNGLFSTYEDSIADRKTKLEEEKEQAIEDIDTKYDIMAAQFAAYASVITTLESSFASLGYTIAESSS